MTRSINCTNARRSTLLLSYMMASLFRPGGSWRPSQKVNKQVQVSKVLRCGPKVPRRVFITKMEIRRVGTGYVTDSSV